MFGAKLDMAIEEGAKVCKYIASEVLESPRKLLEQVRRKMGHGHRGGGKSV